MKILRSIAAVLLGWLTAVILISGLESVNGLFYPPPEGKSLMEWGEEMKKGTPAAKQWIRDIPTSAMAVLQVAWGLAAFVGGAIAALVAGRARLFHASLIGLFILIGTIVNFLQLKSLLDYAHPDWLIITGLLLPLPLSLLGGKLVDWWLPVAPANVPPANGAIREGEPPFRSK